MFDTRRVEVTQHAADRWRERVGGDPHPGRSLLEALSESVETVRRGQYRWRLHLDRRIVFLLDVRPAGGARARLLTCYPLAPTRAG